MKKILLISQNSLSNHANNGKTLSNIFRTWDSNSLAQLYFQDEIPESYKFDKFYRVRDIDLIKKIMHSYYIPVLKVDPLPFVESHYINRSGTFLKLVSVLKQNAIIKDFIREVLYSFNSLYFNDLKKYLAGFSPEAIFFVASDYSFTIDITLKLARYFNIPIYMYVLDDRFFMRKESIWNRFFSRRFLFLMSELVKESEQCFCIGQSMAEKYSEHFKKPFKVLVNPVDEKNISLVNKSYKVDSKEYKFLYAGGLTLGRFDAMLELAKILTCVEESGDVHIEFIVCSGDILSEQQVKELENHSISFLGKLNGNALDELYNEIDFVTHIESDKKKYTRLTALSISTKIPECLIKGVCLVGFGPPEIASMKLIYENDVGAYINSNAGIKMNALAILKLLNSPELCEKLASNGKKFGNKSFTYDSVLENLSLINN